MNIDRQFSNDKPIYLQLVQRIKRLIVSGELKAGHKLESVRDIALEAGVNPNTVQRAFSELEKTGLVYTQRTSGRFITENESLIAELKKSLANEEIEAFFESMNQLGFSKEATITMLKEKSNDHS